MSDKRINMQTSISHLSLFRCCQSLYILNIENFVNFISFSKLETRWWWQSIQNGQRMENMLIGWFLCCFRKKNCLSILLNYLNDQPLWQGLKRRMGHIDALWGLGEKGKSAQSPRQNILKIFIISFTPQYLISCFGYLFTSPLLMIICPIWISIHSIFGLTGFCSLNVQCVFIRPDSSTNICHCCHCLVVGFGGSSVRLL